VDPDDQVRVTAQLDQWQAGLRDALLARLAEQGIALAALSEAVLLLGRRLAELDGRGKKKRRRGKRKRRRRK
jgi:hypothetical protein